ncbi:MAG: response regulator transcription factor, partial [Bacteroidota bacterium]
MSGQDQSIIRVAVFDDNQDRRVSLRVLIEMLTDMEFVGEFPDAVNAVENVEKSLPDVILMDIEMPGVTGIEAVSEIKKSHPNVSILMQTVFDDESIIFEALKAGASGYLLKNGTPEKVIEGIREAHGGGAPMSPMIATKVLGFFRNLPQNDDTKPDVVSE